MDAANAEGEVLFEHISDSDKSLDGAGDEDGDKGDTKDVKLTRQQRKKHKKEQQLQAKQKLKEQGLDDKAIKKIKKHKKELVAQGALQVNRIGADRNAATSPAASSQPAASISYNLASDVANDDDMMAMVEEEIEGQKRDQLMAALNRFYDSKQDSSEDFHDCD